MSAAAWAPCRVLRRINARLGRRGTFLVVLGTGKVCWGIGFLVEPQPTPVGLDLLTSVGPLHCWAWLWIVAGAVMLICAFLKVGRDGLGFAVALVPPATWATAYTVAVLTGDYPRGGYVAVWYLTSHVGVILWAATVPEHSVPLPKLRARRGKSAL